MARAEAIEAIKRLFIAATGEQRSIRSAVATVLFDNAVKALAPEGGLTREELAGRVNDLLEKWQMNPVGEDQINTALYRVGNQLPGFVAAQLPFLGVSNVEGPTRNQRKDRVERVWLAIHYVPPVAESPGLVGRTVEDAVRAMGSNKLAEYEGALSEGAPYEVYEASSHSSPKKLLLVLAITVAACSGYFAWKFAHADHSIQAGVNIRPAPDGRRGVAVMYWTDADGQPTDRYIIYKDGQEYAQITGSGAWVSRTQRYTWIDRVTMLPGQNHTFRLGKRVFPRRTVYVTPTLDLLPCWKCLMDAARVAHDRRTESASDGKQYRAIAGVPLRFGGRLDLADIAPDPHRVVAATKVEVDFGDGTPPRVLDSDNIVHTYLGSGSFTVRVRPLDKRYRTPAPSIVTVGPEGEELPFRSEFLTWSLPPGPDGTFRVVRAGLVGRETRIPLTYWFAQIHRAVAGDYLEKMDVSVDFGDGTALKEFPLSRHISKHPNGSYSLIDPYIEHTWTKPGTYPVVLSTHNHEHEVDLSAFGSVMIYGPPDFRLHDVLVRQLDATPLELWSLRPKETDEYITTSRGERMTASLRPWTDLLASHGFRISDLSLLANYGGEQAVADDDLELGPAEFMIDQGHSWVQFLLADFDRQLCFIGETKVRITQGKEGSTKSATRQGD